MATMAMRRARLRGQVRRVSSVSRPRVLASPNMHSISQRRRWASRARRGGRLETMTGQPSGRRLAAKSKTVPVLALRPEAAADGAGALPPLHTGEAGELAAVVGDDAEVFPEADGEWDIVIVEEFEPRGADERAVGEQDADGRGREMREVALDERDARGHRRVPLPRQHRPEERRPEPARHDGEDDAVHFLRPDRPVGPVARQRPGPCRPGEKRQRPGLAEAHVLEEPLQPALGRRRLHAPAPLAGDVAEFHGPRADHADDQQAERLDTGSCRAPRSKPSGDDGSVRHRDVSLVGVVQKITSSRPQPTRVV